MFYPTFVCTAVCLLATSCKKYWSDLYVNSTKDVSLDKEELIKFQKSSASGSGSKNFQKYSSRLQ